MSSVQPVFSPTESFPAAVDLKPAAQWYAVQTRGRHEKKVANTLQEKGIETFLPALREVHRWSDRNKIVEVPLFPGYAFVRSLAHSPERLLILQTDGVVRIVGNGTELVPVDSKQIEDIRTLLASGVPMAMYPALKVGQRIRVRGGCLDGIEGILVSRPRESTLVLSVHAIQRAIAINLDGYQIEPF
jgi:transcription antitermination factor NusG